ncbi:MAG TPA: hypothetical protein VKH34_11570 [Vicinamibacterales bacterium]|jgi:hypothetical protein|nr:hypothetical protein [Vicinamibacterales bacterium]
MTTSAPFSFVRAIAAVSGVYDGVVGLFLLLAADRFASLFGVAPAQPPIFSDLNGLFLLAVGAGYYWPYRDPAGARWYLWVMGPGLKGAGAVAFLVDYLVRHSPASFLLFAASDGILALLTLAALTLPGDNSTTSQRPTPN